MNKIRIFSDMQSFKIFASYAPFVKKLENMPPQNERKNQIGNRRSGAQRGQR